MEAALFLVDKISLFLMGSHTWWVELSERICYRRECGPPSLPASSPVPPQLALLSLSRSIAITSLLACSTIQRGTASSLINDVHALQGCPS